MDNQTRSKEMEKANEQITKGIQTIVEEHKLPKNCPKIDWGGDFEAMSPDEKVIFLKKFADSFNYALDLMQKERNEWMDRSNNFETQLLDAKDRVAKQMQFAQKLAHENNETKRAYQEKIKSLENVIKGLK
ncbi:MAG: hypothetical protein DWQ49_09570 [Bacteroidetes bacterium]|nr:MAG: hypothetical protein DWQ49_09570 [Bacteroidota bacterium]